MTIKSGMWIAALLTVQMAAITTFTVSGDSLEETMDTADSLAASSAFNSYEEEEKEAETEPETLGIEMDSAVSMPEDEVSEEVPPGFIETEAEELEQDLPEQALPEQDLPEQDLPEQDPSEQDLPEQDLPEQDLPEQDLPEQALSEEDLSEQDAIDLQILEDDADSFAEADHTPGTEEECLLKAASTSDEVPLILDDLLGDSNERIKVAGGFVYTDGDQYCLEIGSTDTIYSDQHIAEEYADRIKHLIIYANYGLTIEPYAFTYLTNLEELIIVGGSDGRASQMEIGEGAFSGLEKLRDISFPLCSSFAIGEGAFSGDISLKSISVSAENVSIEAHAFQYCGGLDGMECFYEGDPSDIAFSAFRMAEGASAVIWIDAKYRDWAAANAGLYEDYGSNIVWKYRDQYCGDNLTWKISDNDELVIRGYGPMYDYYNPRGYTDAIKPPWYEDLHEIKKIVISNGVTTVGNYAFYGMNPYSEVCLGPDLETIGHSAFELKGETALNIPASLKYIAPDGIGLYTSQAKLSFLGEPPSVSVFSFGSAGSALIAAPLGHDSWQALREQNADHWGKLKVLGWVDLEVSNACGESAEWAFTEEGALWITGSGSVRCTWPQSIAIQVREIHVADGITAIEQDTFKGCVNLERLYISSSVSQVAESAFRGCNRSLSGIYVGDGTTPPGQPYYLNQDSGTTYLYLYARDADGRREFEIPENVDYADFSIFENDTQVSHVRVPKDTALFAGSGLIKGSRYPVIECFDHSPAKQFCTENDLPCEIISCGEDAQWRLRNDSELEITGTGSIHRTWPDDIIGKIHTIRIGDGITQIEDDTFAGCGALRTLYVSNDVTQVADCAFSGCNRNLTGIYTTTGTSETEQAYYLNQGSSRMYLHLYERQDAAGHTAREFEIPDSARMVDFSIFEGDTQLASVHVPRNTILTEGTGLSANGNYPMVRCYTNTQAQLFCEDNHIPYELIDASAVTTYSEWNVAQLAFSFANTRAGFQYTNNYIIPLERYQQIYGSLGEGDLAHVLFQAHQNWGGNCFGMSASALLNYLWMRSSGRPFANISAVSDLTISSVNQKLGLDVRTQVEDLQVMQFSDQIQDDYYLYLNDLNTIGKIAEKIGVGAAPEYPLLVMMAGKNPYSGKSMKHIVVGYFLVDWSSTQSRLYVYDSNYPYPCKERYITLTKDPAGNYTGWKYPITDNYTWISGENGSMISCVKYETLVGTWNQRGSLKNLKSLMKIRTANINLKDKRTGAIVARIIDGRLVTDRTDIYQVFLMDHMQNTDPYIYLYVPSGGLYTAEALDGQSGIDITLVDMSGSVSIQTDASEATICANDDSGQYIGEVPAGTRHYTIDINGKITTNVKSGSDVEDGEKKEAAPYAGGDGEKKETVPSVGENTSPGKPEKEGVPIANELISSGKQKKEIKPFIRVNASTVKLKKGQSTTGLKVSMKKGDRIASLSLSKKGIVKATIKDAAGGRIKLKGKRKGKTKLTIHLASGLKKTITIKVQKGAVKTTSITTTLAGGTVLLKGEKRNLGAKVQPFTSKQKLTYRSSNKRIASVSKKGVVTAKKAGTVRIIIRSGKKKKVIKLKVTGSGTVRESMNEHG